jgi:hypothetical protein
MKYHDLLQECLERLRRGEPVDSIVAGRPQKAQLRQDLMLAASSKRAADSLPASTGARARLVFELRAERQRRESQRGVSGWLRAPALALAAVAVAAVLVFVALSAGYGPGGTAEASTLEGVVVENTDGVLTLQTDDGLQQVDVGRVSIVSAQGGASVDLASVEPGQFLVVRGDRARSGVFEARRIELRELAQLLSWCERNADPCKRVEAALAARVCAQEPETCQNIRTRLAELRRKLGAIDRLRDLKNRCDAGEQTACRETQSLCRANVEACKNMRDWLRSKRLQ